MTSLAARLARPEILALPPFDTAAARPERFGADAVKLDANENPYPPLIDGALAAGLNRYPDPQPPAPKRPMAARYRVGEAPVAVTRGAGAGTYIRIIPFYRPGTARVSDLLPTLSPYHTFSKPP